MSDVPLSLRKHVLHAVSARFSLSLDAAEPTVIDASIRAGAELAGANAWILIFAILIASVGLNINSTAVIIGAMLVSPLMGPITGLGYGVGIYDFALIRRSLANLGISAAISLATSAVYFLITPLGEAQSELLARTAPTLWDVLIALFGGLAGIVGATRKERSNVIPGVAIATALMPPLCTAGYGIAKGNFRFFAGAFYLFTLNSVFIAFGAVLVTWLLRLPRHAFVNQATQRHVTRSLIAVVVVAALPSVYLANELVKNELFSSRAREFALREFKFDTNHMTDLRISGPRRRIELTLLGDPLPPDIVAAIKGRLPEAGLRDASLVIHQAKNSIDPAAMKEGILSDLLREGLSRSNQKDDEIASLRLDAARRAAVRAQFTEIAAELKAQYPQLREITVGEGVATGSDATAPETDVLMVTAEWLTPLLPVEQERITAWLTIRAKTSQVRLTLQAAPKPGRGASRANTAR